MEKVGAALAKDPELAGELAPSNRPDFLFVALLVGMFLAVAPTSYLVRSYLVDFGWGEGWSWAAGLSVWTLLYMAMITPLVRQSLRRRESIRNFVILEAVVREVAAANNEPKDGTPRPTKWIDAVQEAFDRVKFGRRQIPLLSLETSLVQQPAEVRDVVRMFYGTDRKPTLFGVGRYTGKRGKLSYGICAVSIPHRHEIGVLERPAWIRLEFREHPDSHVVLIGAKPIEDESLWKSFLASTTFKANTRQVLVFVHGFNVAFDQAARVTAQIAHDLKFTGVSVFYSWPSRDRSLMYKVDEASVQATEAHLERFLLDVLNGSLDAHVFVLAHSMGSRAVTQVVAELARRNPGLGNRLSQIVLAAPDIDADYFKRTLAPRLLEEGLQVTLYASANDKALFISSMFHAHQRAGHTQPEIVMVPGLISIDASAASTDFSGLGHSAFADRRSVLSDMYYLFKGVPPNERHGLSEVRTKSGLHYVYDP